MVGHREVGTSRAEVLHTEIPCQTDGPMFSRPGLTNYDAAEADCDAIKALHATDGMASYDKATITKDSNGR